MRVLILSIIILFTTCVYGQKMDNTASFRAMQSNKYFRVNYDNDYFAAQDKNYTQGYSFEWVTPFLLKNPMDKIFFHLNYDERRAGIVFEHTGFTPSRYERLEIQEGDRPFAAAAILRSFTISTSAESKKKIISHFSFGIMGPAAKGKEIQTGIHKLTGDRVPLGWQNQIENHLVINYGVAYEQELVRVNDNFSLAANASAEIGNLYTNILMGFNTTFGLINNPYASESSRKFMLYGYVQPLVRLVGFDGTLQGNLLGDESIYTIPATDVNRIVGQLNYGIILQTKSLFLEYSRANISREIKTVDPAGWGGVKVGFRL